MVPCSEHFVKSLLYQPQFKTENILKIAPNL